MVKTKQSCRKAIRVLNSGVQGQINFILMMWPFSVLLVLSLSVSSSETQHEYMNWCVIWKRLNNVAHEIPLFLPHSKTVYFSWTDGHWLITLLSGSLLTAVQPQKQKEARESCQLHLLYVTPHFSHTRKGLVSLTWAVDACIFSSYVSSKTEPWTWEETSLICHVLPICWRYQCWSSVGMLKCEHFYSVAGYGSCSW